MGYAALIIGFLLLATLCLLNINAVIAAFTAAFAVVVLAALPLTESLIDVFFGRFGTIAGSMFPMFLFGSILAKIYTGSGAAYSIAETVGYHLFRFAKSEKQKYALGFLSVILSAAIICYGGINAAVALLTIYPIALNIFQKAGIPKRFIMGAICGGAFTFALSGPGSPQPTNVVAMEIGTSSGVGLVAGFVGAIVEIIIMVIILTYLCIRAVKQGEKFLPGPKDVLDTSAHKKIGFFRCILPLLVLLVLFNFLKINIALAILLSCLAAVIIFFPELKKEKILYSLNEGAFQALLPTVTIAGINGFAAVVQTVPEYEKVIDKLLSSSLPPVLMLIFCVSLICMITGGSTTGTQIALPVISPVLTGLGLSLPFIHRVGTFAATMLDSIPSSGAIIMAINVAGLKMKDGYPPVFVSTIIATTCGTIAVALMMSLFPMLP